MKKTGVCPKCGSLDVYNNSNQRAELRRVLQIKNPKAIFGRGSFLVSYICLNCGYVEDYLTEKDLEKRRDIIKNTWTK
ncbi:hypothetical protein [Bernardetia sp.]|uniref:hypothetical protein n=1 Tax=Bernardetia sp. TaxID=1937974 RepID=UPI0025B9B96D|nr:hypothetical protein [Bernardetia sp.]